MNPESRTRQEARGLSILAAALGVAITVALMIALSPALAGPPAADLTIEMRSSTLLFMDGGAWCAPSTTGPETGFFHLRVANNRPNQIYRGLEIAFAAPAGLTIRYPEGYLGDLEPGEAADVYFYVDYSQLRAWPGCQNNGKPPVNYNQVFTATLRSRQPNGMNGERVFTQSLTSAELQSAAVGGQRNEITFPSSAVQGSYITATVEFGYGNNADGTQLLAQFAGNRSFRADCFQLEGVKVVTSTIPAIPVGQTGSFFFPSVNTSNGDSLGLAYRFFVYCGGVSTSARPWSEITSGSNQKYNLVSFQGEPPLPLPPSQPVKTVIQVLRSVSQNVVFDGGTVVHTISFLNRAKQPVFIGNIQERQANGIAFAGVGPTSQVNSGTSTISPTLGAQGVLRWYGQPQVTYRIPPSGTLGAGLPGILTMSYTSTLPATQGFYTNWISATVGGDSTQAISVTVEVRQSPTAVSVGSFAAQRQGAEMRLAWDTSDEINTLGFMIYRQALPVGVWELLTPEMIPAQTPGMLLGAQYAWLDATAQPETAYAYRLVEIGRDGGRAPLGVIETVAQAFLRFLPAVRK